jgi:predicted transcriptional regulator of viral defense system
VKVKQFFDTHPVFRYEEFATFMTAQGTTRPESWRQQLGYHQKAGHLNHIRKILYAVKPILSQGQWVDPYLIAGKATADATLAYHTALELHGVAYTTFSELTFLTNRQTQPFSHEAQRFRPVIQPKALIAGGHTDFGVDVAKRAGVTVRLTSLERSIVDVLDRPHLGGGWEEIWRSLDNVTQLDLDKLVAYVLLLGNSTVVAKVGFFLDQRPSHLAVDQIYIKKLLPHVSKQPHYMNRDRHGEGKYIEKWQLIVPMEIINRMWEEPNAENI